MPEDLSKLNDGNFANRVCYLLFDSFTIARTWGFYMRDPQMDREQELRNRLTAIWIRALIDTIEGEQRYLLHYRVEAQRRGFQNVVLVCERASEYFRCVRSLLSRFTKEEQILLFYVRNTLVHGWINAEHAHNLNIKWFDGSAVVVERLDRASYWDLKRKFLGNFYSGKANLDEQLAPIRERFQADSSYWAILGKVLSDDFDRMVERGIDADLGLK